ncbi:hypothetical protein D3C76_922700 [compost metagenome]
MEKIEYLIRHPDHSDLEKIVAFYLKEISPNTPYKLVEETILYHMASTQRLPPTNFMIACKDGDILALSITRFSHTSKAYEIECTTKVDLRRQGIAYSLITNSMTQCQKSGFFSFLAHIHHENIGCISLFEKIGFKLNKSITSTKYQTYLLTSSSAT